MRIDRTIINSKVGRRTLRLFVSSALMPIVALAIIAFGHVSRELETQTHERLHQVSKATAMTVAERLGKVETELREFTADIEHGPGPSDWPRAGARLQSSLRGLTVVTPGGNGIRVFGDAPEMPLLSPSESGHLASGRAVVRTDSTSGRTGVWMIVTAGTGRSQTTVVAEVDSAFLWDGLSDRSPVRSAGTCILGSSGEVLYSSLDATENLVTAFHRVGAERHTGEFQWNDGADQYLAGYWSIFLRSMYYTSQWTAVLTESRAEALAPIINFKRTFPFVIVISIMFVLVLSLVQIRRSLVPLGELQETTARLASGDLEARAHISSGDEFERLGDAFNTMAQRLADQFKTLTTIAKIDRVLLSSLDQDTIIETVLREVPMAFPCEVIMLVLLDGDEPGERTAYIRSGRERFNTVARLTKTDIEELYRNREHLFPDHTHKPPAYLSPMYELRSSVVLPIFLKSKLSGFVALGHAAENALTQNDTSRARQLVDQVAVALTNARLVTELDTLNLGTLTALGRAIDAKSSWTQGHSERVTRVAVKIGRHMGLEADQLAVFHRAGLLHDIGKIAVPQSLIDKPGPLTADEMAIVREHVRHGARILEPIAAFRDIMPIVMQHHERWDGGGYPEGLAGEEIDFGARIFAVADCFDAIVSDRPYRRAMEMGEVLRIIREGSGQAFDPEVVDAFFEVIADEHYAASEAPTK